MQEREALLLVKQRYEQLFWQGCVREYINIGYDPSLSVDPLVPGDAPGTYYWPDLDYTNLSRSCWDSANHYNRILRLLCQDGKEKIETDEVYRERVIGTVRYWLVHDFINPNWWHNDIGTPNHMTALGLMLWEYLPDDMKEGMVALAARGSMKTRTDIPKWTGANLIWGISNSIRHALMTEDEELLRVAAARAEQEIYAGHTEGIQDDGSFCQHGPRWYSGGYGSNFTFDLSQLAYVFAGTPYAFSKEKIDILLLHVLDGQRNMMHHGYFDYNGVGREFTRRRAVHSRIIHFGVELLCRIEDIARRDELLAFRDENARGVAVTDEGNSATRHYPKVSYLAHNKNGTHIGIKCHAPGQYDMEVCNAEGHLCYNMSYGTRTCFMRRGDEYLDVNPIFDFAHMPGTTARLETDDQLKVRMDWWCLPLPNDHTGGRTVGDRGIIFERPEHDGIRATVSFFAFDGKMVALGADIRDESPEKGALTTTVDQCRARDMQWSEDGRSVHHGEFTYYNLDENTELCANITHREGSWTRNSYEEPLTHEEGELFCAYIPVKEQGASYAYAVCPRGQAHGVKVLCNTAACQAILLSDGTVMAVFHEDGECTIGARTLIGKARECRIEKVIENKE